MTGDRLLKPRKKGRNVEYPIENPGKEVPVETGKKKSTQGSKKKKT